jgi:hypothetical protein
MTSAGVVTTLAGLAGSAGSADGTGSAARFNTPEGVAVDGSSNVYVADSGNHTIRKITPGGVVTTLAGLAGSSGSADGTGSAARFNFPVGVALDGSGNVYVADSLNNTIRKMTSAGVVTTLAGLAGSAGSADGAVSAARFNEPFGVAVDGSGNIYVADTFNFTIRKITPPGYAADFAIAMNPANESFGGLWQLANGGANSLPFITSVNLTPTGTATAPTYTFSVSFSQIGLPANPPVGTIIKLLATYVSDTGYRSDESDLGNLTGTPGWNPFTATGYATYAIEASANLDSVGDGIPDSWRAHYFGGNGMTTNAQSCATCDPDGDGFSNLQEFQAGFNPTDSGAYPHIISVAKSGNDIKVTYLGANGDSMWSPGVASRTNVLEVVTNSAVSGSFPNSALYAGIQTNILSGGTGLGTPTNMVDSGGATNIPARYYRIRVVP